PGAIAQPNFARVGDHRQFADWHLWEPAPRFRRARRHTADAHEGGLQPDPILQARAEAAIRVINNSDTVDRPHQDSCSTGIRASGGKGGRMSTRPLLRSRWKTYKLKKCIAPRTINTRPNLSHTSSIALRTVGTS